MEWCFRGQENNSLHEVLKRIIQTFTNPNHLPVSYFVKSQWMATAVYFKLPNWRSSHVNGQQYHRCWEHNRIICRIFFQAGRWLGKVKTYIYLFIYLIHIYCVPLEGQAPRFRAHGDAETKPTGNWCIVWAESGLLSHLHSRTDSRIWQRWSQSGIFKLNKVTKGGNGWMTSGLVDAVCSL